MINLTALLANAENEIFLYEILFAGEPGSKPFPEFTVHKDESTAEITIGSAARTSSVRPTAASALLAADILKTSDKTKSKITPVKRTRFRSKDNRKIVLKRRKVKRVRTKPSTTVSSEDVEDDVAVGLAPEAHRGGSLAELALATLSKEETEEVSDETNTSRDITIMN